MNFSTHSRRDFLKLAGFSAASLALPGCAAMTDKLAGALLPKKPNIVLFLADDLGWHQLGCYGSRFYETPNIDNLAKQGMKFTDAYAAAAVCSPTRASIMTGKYPARLHLTDFIKGGSPKDKKLLTPEWTPYLPLKEKTIGEILRPAGYATGHFGKWHLNRTKKYEPGRPGDPRSQGFDDAVGTHKPGKGPTSPYENDWHHTHHITKRSLAFIERNKDKPFFCMLSFNAIHRPEKETQELIEKYRNKPGADNDEKYGHNNPKQAAMLETMDKCVAKVLKKLDQLNLSENTMVVFFSDNGHLGPKDCAPLRGSKSDLYEGGIRVPWIVRWPGVVKPATECHEPVISIDFLPTFAEAAGLKITGHTVDGKSIIPLLKRTGKPKREAIYFHYPHYHHQSLGPCGAIRQGKYKLIEWFEESIDGVYKEGALELYDLSKDLGERNNIAREKPQVTADLYVKLKNWRKCVGAQQMPLNPDYKSG